MKKATDKVFYVGTHHASFNAGVPGEVIGMVFVRPRPDLDRRLCYHVQWANGAEDYCVVEDKNTYELIGFADILSGDIPQIK